MLIGIALFLALVVYAGWKSTRAIKKHVIRGEPTLTREDDLVTAGEDGVSRRIDELTALGFTSEGTWRYQGNDPEAANQKQQTLAIGWLSPDRTVEVLIGLTRVLGARHVARAVPLCSVRSFTADGQSYLTVSAGKLPTFPTPPRRHIQRVAGRSLRDLLTAHTARLTGEKITPVALDPDGFVAREIESSRTSHEHWVASGITYRDGDVFRYTNWGALRFFLRPALWPPVQAAHFVKVSFAFIGVLALSGGAAWLISQSTLPIATKQWYAAALFAALATCMSIVVRAPLAWGHACIPAAVVFHLMGMTAGWPWLAAYIAASLLQPSLRAAQFKRQHALFEAAEGRKVEPPRARED